MLVQMLSEKVEVWFMTSSIALLNTVPSNALQLMPDMTICVFTIGVRVGLGVGIGVGAGEGTIVGAAVGTDVGTGMGAAVGV